MATETQIQKVIEDPILEKYRQNLAKAAYDFATKRLGEGYQDDVDYRVAGLGGLEEEALALARQSAGQYQPYLQRAGESLGVGREALLGAMQDVRRPDVGIAQFMNPYEAQVVQQTMQDLQRQSDILSQQQDAQAIARGAYGGSRATLQDLERERNLLDAQARAAGQLRQSGFGQAAQLAQQQAQLTGALGEGVGKFAAQEAGLGELQQRLMGQDISQLGQAGALERQMQQAQLDAARQSNLQREQFPYQQYGFISDILRGIPTSQGTMTMQQFPTPSPFQKYAGLGISGLAALSGAKTAGLF
jgi:hypothetical protein